MAQSVLLVFESPRRKQLFINTLPPLGILGIASFLRARGIPVRVRDCCIDTLTDDDLRAADIVGLSVNISNVERSLETARRVRRAFPGKTVIAGGPLCASIPARMAREECLDAVAAGEGEEIMAEAAEGKPLGEIRGLYLRDGSGGVSCTGERPWITDLDRLPFPALDMVDLPRYYSPVKKARPISNLISSRGCPYGCIYCFKTMGSTWRARYQKNVVDEIEWQVRELGVREICIYDDNFTMDPRRAEEICDGILDRGIRVRLQLTNGIRADRVTRETIRKLKRAGAWIVGVAPESGSAETLKRIGKGFVLPQVDQAVRWCREEGIRTWSFFMVGFPWETEGDVEETICYATALSTDLTQFSRVTAFPGTALYDILGGAGKGGDFNLVDHGLFYGGVSHETPGLSDESLARLVKRAYRRVYLRPGKMLRLVTMLSPLDLWKLFFYSVTTGSV